MGKRERKVEEEPESSDLEEDVFEVETILDSKVSSGRTQYFIKWKGYNDDFNTWEDEANVEGCPDKVKAYEKSKKNNKPSTPKKKKESNGNVDEKLLIRNATKTKNDYKELGVPYVDGIGFEYGDKLEEIVGCKPFGGSNVLFFYVKWYKKENLTWVSNNSIKDKEPLALIEFYENRLKFGYKGEEN